MLIGVAVFSLVMGEFIEILMNYKNRFVIGAPRDLSKWIALLSRFNNGNPIDKDLISKIEDFFEYSWQYNRLNAVKTETDLRFMDELPLSVQSQIITEYLFSDFLAKYEFYFKPDISKKA